MTLYMIGIGLNDEKDISMKGLEAVRRADHVYLESYTSFLQVSILELENFYKKKIVIAERDLVEKKADEILEKAKDEKVAFLVVGDVFGATTHTDLMLRARKDGIDVEIINNASILNAIGIVGLELYKFGRTASVPYPEVNFNPETAYEVIKGNQTLGLHTLVLLDIKPEKNMTIKEAINILLGIEEKRKEKVFTKKTMVIGCARIGGDYKIRCGTAEELTSVDFGSPLHCIIIPGKLHFVEEEALEKWK